jgi:hypothetical protein
MNQRERTTSQNPNREEIRGERQRAVHWRGL